MTERTPRYSTLLILVALAALISACAWQQGAATPVAHQSIRQPAEPAARAEISITTGVSQLQIGALDGSGDLIAGEVAYDARNRLEQQYNLSGDTATFTLEERDAGGLKPLIRSGDEQIRWDLGLSRQLPISLAVHAGVGENTLDLAELRVTELNLSMGVGNTALTLPRQGQVLANIAGGIGNLTVTIPRGMAARIDTGSDLGNVRIMGDYALKGNVYVSPDFATAANRIDLRASKGLGTITVITAAE